MELREQYYEETGQGVLNVIDGKVTGNYTNDYVFWLESKIKTSNKVYVKCPECNGKESHEYYCGDSLCANCGGTGQIT